MAPNAEAAHPPGAAPGLITMASAFGVAETVDRLLHALQSKGLTLFCRIDHAANAVAVGLPLRPTTLLIFGNARSGTPLMQASQTLGIDLPLKALAWEDAAGCSWLSYNDPVWIAGRHGLEAEGTGAPAMRDALAAVTKPAAMP